MFQWLRRGSIAWWLLQGMSDGPDRLSGRMNDPDALVNSNRFFWEDRTVYAKSEGFRCARGGRAGLSNWGRFWTAQIIQKLIMKGIDLLKTGHIKLEGSDAPVADTRLYSATCLVTAKEKIGPPRSNFSQNEQPRCEPDTRFIRGHWKVQIDSREMEGADVLVVATQISGECTHLWTLWSIFQHMQRFENKGPLHTRAKSRDLVMVRALHSRKAIIGCHGPPRIVWSENRPCCQIIAYFVGEKRGEDLD